jgi:glycosyltransferase involved in cell wall biosynthesis
MRTAVVAHSGRRDGYQVAAALMRSGLLHALVTELYFDSGKSDLWSATASRFGVPLYKRSHPDIPKHLVRQVPLAMAVGQLKRLFQRNIRLQRLTEWAISRRALKEACHGDHVLFSYSTNAFWAFKVLAKLGRPRMLFQMHPEPSYLARLYREELERFPDAALSLLSEMELRVTSEELWQLGEVTRLATSIVVASSFTKRTLVESGIGSDKIAVVPYGVDCSAWPRREVARPVSGPLRLVFVGSLIQRKGIGYLLNAVSRFRPDRLELTLVTRDFEDTPLLTKKVGSNVEIRRRLSQQELVTALHAADLFVLPSIAEGFGQVIVEAMACGLPVLATENTAAADIVEHGSHGWVVTPRSEEEIVRVLDYALSNRQCLFEMGQRAAARASELSWERFHRGIVEFYRAGAA